MPVASQDDAFLTVWPDAEDFIQFDGHKDANAADGEIHKYHLPADAEFERVASQRFDFLEEIAFLDALPMTVTGKVIRKDLKALSIRELQV